jgi:hypothetical protein
LVRNDIPSIDVVTGGCRIDKISQRRHLVRHRAPDHDRAATTGGTEQNLCRAPINSDGNSESGTSVRRLLPVLRACRTAIASETTRDRGRAPTGRW